MIYVDSPKVYKTPLRYKKWSHMWSDLSDDELHAMAAKLGLQRTWFQQKERPGATEEAPRYFSHYDLVPTKRALALKLGAIAMEIDDFIAQPALLL